MLIRGDRLTPQQRAHVLAAFGYRWTVQNLDRARRWMPKPWPTIAPVLDDDWLATHAFHFVKDGSRLHARRPTVPAYLAYLAETDRCDCCEQQFDAAHLERIDIGEDAPVVCCEYCAVDVRVAHE